MEPFIGTIMMFAGNFAPRGWALCDGQLLPISQNTALFSILGTSYGGDGVQTFALPDLRGRVPMHAGNGPGLTPRRLGEHAGAESVTLTVNNLPTHNHALNVFSQGGDQNTPVGNFAAKVASSYSAGPADAEAAANSIGSAGKSQPVAVVQPFAVVNFIIALEGLYPSRS